MAVNSGYRGWRRYGNHNESDGLQGNWGALSVSWWGTREDLAHQHLPQCAVASNGESPDTTPNMSSAERNTDMEMDEGRTVDTANEDSEPRIVIDASRVGLWGSKAMSPG